MQQDGDEHPGDDAAHLLHAKIDELCGRAIGPQNAGENAEGVNAEADSQRSMSKCLADAQAGDPFPKRAALFRFERAILHEREQRERQSDEQRRNADSREKHVRGEKPRSERGIHLRERLMRQRGNRQQHEHQRIDKKRCRMDSVTKKEQQFREKNSPRNKRRRFGKIRERRMTRPHANRPDPNRVIEPAADH